MSHKEKGHGNDSSGCSSEDALSDRLREQLRVDDHSDVDGDNDNDNDEKADVVPSSTTKTAVTATAAAIASTHPPIFLLDAGYGFPREVRPRKEKILAISRQIVNFLEWQSKRTMMMMATQPQSCGEEARVQVVACPDESICQALLERTTSLWNDRDTNQQQQQQQKQHELPAHVSFSCQSLEDVCQEFMKQEEEAEEEPVIYLSPDAETLLDPGERPPRIVVIGLLIDRRVQPRRSQQRATQLQLTGKRWPLEECFSNVAWNEPLNVDCILEGMQQWWWNQRSNTVDGAKSQRETFISAATQALQHHANRHPSRPLHKTSTSS